MNRRIFVLAMAVLACAAAWLLWHRDAEPTIQGSSYASSSERESVAPSIRPITDEPSDAVRSRVDDSSKSATAQASVFGRIVDDRGAEVVGARVILDLEGENGDFETMTDSSGAFRFDAVAPRVRATIDATTIAGRDPTYSLTDIVCEPEQRFDAGVLVLPRPAIVRGRVVDEDGKPVSGAIVQRNGTAETAPPSDEQGVFCFATERDSTCEILLAHRDGFVPDLRSADMVDLHAGEEFESVDLHVTRARNVRGRVVDAHGQPIAQARVVVVGAQVDLVSSTCERAWNPILSSAKTDEQGRYELAAPASRSAALDFEHGHFSPATRDLSGADEEPDMILRRSPHLRLELVDASTQSAITPSKVRGFCRSAREQIDPLPAGQADRDCFRAADGSFEFVLPRPLDFRSAVYLDVPGYVRTLVGVFDPLEFDGRRVRVLLQAGGLVRGRVLDTNGLGRAGAYVSAQIVDRDPTHAKGQHEVCGGAATNEAGEFSIECLPARELELVARSGDRTSDVTVSTGVDLRSSPSASEVILTFPALGAIECSVLDGGVPATGRFALYECETPVRFVGATDEKAVIRAADQVVGSATFVLVPDELRNVAQGPFPQVQVEIQPGVVSRFSIDLAQTDLAQVTGSVMLDGHPVAGSSITLVRSGNPELEFSAQIDGVGRFSFSALLPGSYVATVDRATDSATLFVRSFELLPRQRLTLEFATSTGSVRGRIVDAATGASIHDPRTDTTVWLQLVRASARDRNLAEGGQVCGDRIARADGSFEFATIAEGEYGLDIECRGASSAFDRRHITVLAGRETFLDIRLEPPGSLALQCDAWPDEVKAVEWFEVLAERSDGTEWTFEATLEEGTSHYVADRVPPGDYSLIAGFTEAGKEGAIGRFQAFGRATVHVTSQQRATTTLASPPR